MRVVLMLESFRSPVPEIRQAADEPAPPQACVGLCQTSNIISDNIVTLAWFQENVAIRRCEVSDAAVNAGRHGSEHGKPQRLTTGRAYLTS
jgi:hypothetical protein